MAYKGLASGAGSEEKNLTQSSRGWRTEGTEKWVDWDRLARVANSPL
jgi:hypothetical protein